MKTSAKHTPGPWQAADDGIIESDCGTVATVHGHENPDDETRPNAALIAAAPDLLAACEQAYEAAAVEWMRSGKASPQEPMSALMAILAQAIAKAQG